MIASNKSLQHVAVIQARRPIKDGTRPWTVFWVGEQKTVVQNFDTRQQAFAAVDMHPTSAPVATVKVPPYRFPLAVPSARAIAAWMEVADIMLADALARKEAR